MDNQTFEFLIMATKRTGEHAMKNIKKHGLQDFKTLIVVATEELGETAREVLEWENSQGGEYEDDSLDRIHAEAKDLAAVGLQIMVLVDKIQEQIKSGDNNE